METINMRTIGVIFSAGILLTSCVSSKKYHRSEAEVAKLRNDSTTLAQQSSTLQQNLSSMQQKNSDLQKTIENNNTANAGLTKNVAYYREYTEKQQASTTQMKSDVSTALASSGISDQDVILTEGKIYINVAEKNLFKGNTAMLTPKGRDLVNNIGQFVKSHDGVDVSVADLQEANMSGAAGGSTGMNGSGSSTSMSSSSNSTSGGNSSTTSGNNGTSGNSGNNSSTAGMSTDQTSNGAMASNGSSSRSRRSGSRASRHSGSTSSSSSSTTTTSCWNNRW